MSELSASIATNTSTDGTMPSSKDNHRPASVSRSTSEPVQKKLPDPPSSSSSSPTITLKSKSADIPPTILDEEDDNVLAQATAIALQAQKQLAKQAMQLNNKKSQNPILAAIESHANNAGVTFTFAGHTVGGGVGNGNHDLYQQPMGDLEQRKLIEQKLGSQGLSYNNHNSNHIGSQSTNNHSRSSANNTSAIGGGIKDVKEKLEQFFQTQSGPSVNKVQNMTTTTTTTTNNENSSNAITTDGTNDVTCTPPRPSQQLSLNENATARNITTTTEKPLLSATVWKRRSGYGKFSMNAWEKREIQLVGSKVMYFKYREKEDRSQAQSNNDNQLLISQQQQPLSSEDIQKQSSHINPNSSSNDNYVSATPTPSLDNHHSDINSTPNGSMNDGTSLSNKNTVNTISYDVSTANSYTSNVNNSRSIMNSTSATSTKTITKPSKKDLHQFWEQTKQNITKSINELSINNNNPNNTDDDLDSPRGIIDLEKENVSVAAISDHEKSLTSVSPTPYGLCIFFNKLRKGGVTVVGGSEQNKWKICFESHGEQIRWLTVLTDIIVRKSVNLYNQDLINSKHYVSPSLNDSLGVVGGNKIISSGSNSSGGGGVNNLLEGFRPSPRHKDGMWSFDEQFSSKNLLDQLAGSAVTGKTRNGDVNDDDISYDEDDQDKEKFDFVSTPPSISASISMKESDILESPIIYDLPEAITALILNGAKSSHGWFIKGHNLTFVFGVINLSLVWLYVSPVHWLLFPLYLMLVNTVMLMVVMETNTNNERKPLKSIPSCAQMLRRKFKNKQSKGREKAAIAKNPPKTSEIKSTSMKKLEHDNVITNAAKKPIAGTSTKRLSDPSDSHFVNNHEFISWAVHSPQDVQVRSHGYLRTKMKVPSPASLYEVTNVEVFESDYRVPEMASKVVLPKINYDENIDDNVRWKSPDTFIVSLAIPTDEPSLTRPTEDGFGVSVTIYYKMKKETREILKRISEPGYNPSRDTTETHLDVQKRVTNGVRLWEEWCRRAPTDADWQARFKLLPNVLNPVEVGLPSWIGKYCGKPVLIKRRGKTGFLSTHPDLNTFEFDISLHVFPYLAKKAMAYLRSTIFKKALVSLTYVVESRADDELPEVVIGEPVKIYYPNPDILIHANHFFAGTAPKSIKLD